MHDRVVSVLNVTSNSKYFESITLCVHMCILPSSVPLSGINILIILQDLSIHNSKQMCVLNSLPLQYTTHVGTSAR